MGRESTAQYNEEAAGVRKPNYVSKYQFTSSINGTDAQGRLLPMVQPGPLGEIGSADDLVQAYNYRLCVTRNATAATPFGKPSQYDPARWVSTGEGAAASASALQLKRALCCALLIPPSVRRQVGAVPSAAARTAIDDHW